MKGRKIEKTSSNIVLCQTCWILRNACPVALWQFKENSQLHSGHILDKFATEELILQNYRATQPLFYQVSLLETCVKVGQNLGPTPPDHVRKAGSPAAWTVSFTSLDPFTCKAHWRSQVSKAFTVSSPWFRHVFTYYKVININSKHLNKYNVYSQLVICLTRGLAFTRFDAKWQSGLHWKRPVANHFEQSSVRNHMLLRTNHDAPARIVILYHLIIIWKYYTYYSYHNIVSILSLISYTHIPENLQNKFSQRNANIDDQHFTMESVDFPKSIFPKQKILS